MNHPTQNELFDLRRDELEPETARRVREHLSGCETCRQAMEELADLEVQLDAVTAGETDAGFTDRTMAAIRSDSEPAWVGRRDRGLVGRWGKRFSWAAAVVLLTLGFQVGVWSPLGGNTTVHTFFPVPVSAEPLSPQNVPSDSTLLVTVREGPLFEVPFLDGTRTMSELVDALREAEAKGRYDRIVIVGAEPDAIVSIDADDLEPLADYLGVRDFQFGSGISIYIRREEPRTGRLLDPRVSLQLVPRMVEVIRAPTVRLNAVTVMADSARLTLNSPARVYNRTVTIDSVRAIRITPRIVLPTRKQLTVTWLPLLKAGTDERAAEELRTGKVVRIAVTADGRVALDRQFVEEAALDAVFRRLLAHDPDMAITIVLGEEDAAWEARLVAAANRAGFKTVRVKYPD